MEDEMQDMKKQGESIARTKTEIDIENHVLQATVKLSDDSEGRVFSRSPRNKDFLFSYSCHICGVPCLVGERMLQIHMAGRRHQARLNVNVFDAEQYRASLVTKPKRKTSENYPQEPLLVTWASYGISASSGADGTSTADSTDGALAEGENKPAAQLQGVLDGYRAGPLVGLEYIIELKGKGLTYQCALCDVRGNTESGITTHMILPEHRIKFLEKHYPTVMKHLAPYRNKAGADAKESVFCRVVQTVCEAIEDHHGRMTPQAYECDDFVRNRTKYIQAVKFGQHFDEHTGPKFVELIDKKVLQDLKSAAQENPSASVDGERGGGGSGGGVGHRRYRNRNERGSLDSISSLSSANSVMSISSSGDQNNDRERLRKRSPLNRARQPGGVAKLPPRKIVPSPAELSRQAEQLAHERYKWEKYRCTVDLAVAQLTKQMKEYEKNPEKHPKYSEEWKMFWNRRYKELQAEKKDPQKHNFKPEWIEYWTKRMKDLHDEEVQRKKLEVRTKLNLSAEEEDRTNELREQYTLHVPPSSGTTAAKASRSNDSKGSYRVSNSGEDEADYKGGQPRQPAVRSRKRAVAGSGSHFAEWEAPSYKRATSHSRRSRSPISDDEVSWMSRGTSQVGSKRSEPATVPDHVDYDEWAKNYYGPNNKVFVRTDFDARNAESINFIAVFRLLTALEDYLGSLGPKVIDLLSKGLALEKVKANSADDLLMNEDNSMFLETVKEKLKGHMMAGTIDPLKVSAIKKAIQNIASLLHEASKREPVAPKPVEEEVSRDSQAASESGAASIAASSDRGRSGLDKAAIAGQLAKALVAQGKIDFSTEELEQLINVYIAMVEISRERKTIITTKTYLTALSAGGGGSGVRVASDAADDGGMMHREQPAAMLSLGPMFDRTRIDPSAMNVSRRVPEVAKKVTPAPITNIRSSTMLENISDSDLQTLLKNFKDLVGEEQMHLISYLRKLERSEPERVERLRHYVDFDSWDSSAVAGRTSDDERNSYQDPDDDLDFDSYRQTAPSRQSPLKHRNVTQNVPSSGTLTQTNLQLEKQTKQAKQFMDDSEDDEDYSYDDILRAASKNVSSLPARDVSEAHDTSSNHSQRLNAPDGAASGSNAPVSSLADTNNLVANLMESLQKSFTDASNKGTAGSAGKSDYSNPITTIGSLGGNGTQDTDGGMPAAKGTNIQAINSFGTNGKGPNASAMGPFYPQQANMQAMMQQQQMAGAFGQQMPQGPMQPFGQQFMYQGQQPFVGNINGSQQQMQAQQQAAQFGYGNYGSYY
ncbi:uncharacterized protein CG7065-like [Anopheles cruzii]|uniref:uncharacterized protein CG7065-like n=1 Tax=Anopheles cruzii TaxID=68878 RepID=UPI0022EC7486|nr:uncharacterized protein CG7065-like [Anopheles cruzii]